MNRLILQEDEDITDIYIYIYTNKTIPNEITILVNLTRLDVVLYNIAPIISKLTSLTSLKYGPGEEIENLDGIKNLTFLKRLSIYNNINISENVFNPLTSLRSLVIQYQ